MEGGDSGDSAGKQLTNKNQQEPTWLRPAFSWKAITPTTWF